MGALKTQSLRYFVRHKILLYTCGNWVYTLRRERFSHNTI